MKNYKFIFGIVIWLVIAVVTIVQFNLRSEPDTEESLKKLVGFSVGSRQKVDLNSEYYELVAVSDPIFLLREDGIYQRIGEIQSIDVEDDTISARAGFVKKCNALFYSSAPVVTEDCTIQLHETPASLEWIVNEMAKDGAWEEYKGDLLAAFREHGKEVIAEFRPIVEQGLREASVVVAEELKASYEKRRHRIAKIASRYETELVKEKIVPLIKDEIWPIVRAQTEPKLNEVGQEIWQSASLWRFSWRLAYDKMPLPRRDLAKKEWQRFVDNEAVPILEAHLEEFVQIQKRILADIAKNDEVISVFKESVSEIVNDREIREIMQEILVEVFIENPRLKKLLNDYWKSKETQLAVSDASLRFEKTLVTISEKMFGTPETQITTSFARVLRNQVLRKDQRWFVVTFPDEKPSSKPAPAESLAFDLGVTGNENPFINADEIPQPKTDN